MGSRRCSSGKAIRWQGDPAEVDCYCALAKPVKVRSLLRDNVPMVRKMIKSILFLGVVLSCSLANGCTLSDQDQISLVRLTSLPPGVPFAEAESLAGQEVQCAQIASFRIVDSSKRLFYLDPERVFSRWSVLGRVLEGNRLDAVKVFWESSRFATPDSLWREYGRGPYSSQELEVLSTANLQGVQWRSIRLLTHDEIDKKSKVEVARQIGELIRSLIREKIELYLYSNSPAGYGLMAIEYPNIYQFSSVCTVGVKVKQGSRIRVRELKIPVNTMNSPFVGYVEDVNMGVVPEKFLRDDHIVMPRCQ